MMGDYRIILTHLLMGPGRVSDARASLQALLPSTNRMGEGCKPSLSWDRSLKSIGVDRHELLLQIAQNPVISGL
jgi:hypothetical protein